MTAALPLPCPLFVFSWKRCLSKQLLSGTAASPLGMDRECDSSWDHNNPCGLGCHGRHNGELCDCTKRALSRQNTARLCSTSPRRDNRYFLATMDKHTFCIAVPASSLSCINYNHNSPKATQSLNRQSNHKIFKLHWEAGSLCENKPSRFAGQWMAWNPTVGQTPTPLISPSHLSADPLLPVSAPCTRSAPAMLNALIPAGSVLSHQDAVGNTESIFFIHSCIPGNAEGLRNHISNASAAAAVTLLHVKEQACPQQSRSSLQPVPAGPQTRQGMGGSKEREEGREQIRLKDGELILTGTGKSGR